MDQKQWGSLPLEHTEHSILVGSDTDVKIQSLKMNKPLWSKQEIFFIEIVFERFLNGQDSVGV